MNFISTHFMRYEALGWSVIPINERSKQPHVSWRNYEEKRPTRDQMMTWAKQWPSAGLAVITGTISGVIVIDDDGGTNAAAEAFLAKLPPTARVKTSKGFHLYFRLPANTTVPTKVRFMPGLDVRGEGGYALVPPSIHPDGSVYTWQRQPEDGIAELPAWAVEQIGKSRAAVEAVRGLGVPVWKTALGGVREGSRNDSAASYAGKLLSVLPQDLWEVAGWESLQAWNAKNNPPLDAAELRTTFESVAKKEGEKRSKTRPTSFFTAADLDERDMPETGFAVTRLLPEGLSMLVGKPKDGKSTLALQFALAVASGTAPFKQNVGSLGRYGRFDSVQGSVLYAALEDSEARLKKRLRALKGQMPAPRNLHLTTYLPPMHEGGLAMIEAWLKEHTDAKLVIVDTWVAFMGEVASKSSDAFAAQYRMLRPLFDLAHEYHISVLVLHHRKKGNGDDPIDAVAGTGGMTAVLDAYLYLDRAPMSPNALLATTGRDIETEEIGLQHTAGVFGWGISDQPIAAVKRPVGRPRLTDEEKGAKRGKKIDDEKVIHIRKGSE